MATFHVGNYIKFQHGQRVYYRRYRDLESITDAYLVSRGMPRIGVGLEVGSMQLERKLRGAKIRII